MIDKVLGKGTFGEVRKATHKKGQFVCAVKVIDKQKLKSNQVYFKLMQDELKVLQQTSHFQIMNIFELLEDSKNFYVVSEFLVGGELFDRIKKMKRFSEQKASYVIY